MHEILIRKDSRNKHLLALCCVFSLLVLIFSFAAQYLWKIEPCRLCKLQRIPYLLLAVLTVLGLIRMKYSIIRILIICLFVISAVLSLYHLLLIAGVVHDFCAVKATVETLDDFMALLEAPIPCSKAGWKILNIPASGYNLLCSLAFVWVFSRNWLQTKIIDLRNHCD